MIKTYKLINSIINLAIIIVSSTKLEQIVFWFIIQSLKDGGFFGWPPYTPTAIPIHTTLLQESKMSISISDKILH